MDLEMAGTLYLVGTPIGNLGDLTDRARTTLGEVDVVAAEDTRRTGALLRRLGIRAPELVSFFEGNERERAGELLRRLRDGRDVAVVTDAGMPSVSDPGFRLVRACAEEGIDVRVVPGPSAAVAALVVSGLATDRVAFEGFLPRKAGDRRERLRALADDPRTLVLFESPRRVAGTLEELVTALGDRRVALARELTKVHEEVLRGSASQVLAEVRRRGELKGEVVLVVEGASGARVSGPSMGQLVTEARELAAGGMRKREAAAEVAHRHDAPANAIYRELIKGVPPP